MHLKTCQETPDIFGSVSNVTVQQHPDAEVSKAHTAILVSSTSNESLPSNQGPTQMLVTTDLTGTNELKNYYYYLCSISV